jgi:hypothetical protein
MHISEAIDELKALKAKHGNIEVFFDCPKCRESFTPNSTVAVAVHMTEAGMPAGQPTPGW